MKLLRKLIIVAVAFLLTGSAIAQTKQAKDDKLRFFTWGYDNEKDWDALFADMKDVGMTTYIISASPKRVAEIIPIADKYGIEVYSWVWTLNCGNDSIAKIHPDWFSVNREGKSLIDKQAYVGYYRFLSPIIPGVREHIIKNIINPYLDIPGLKGISIDYHRMVDVILPTLLQPGYNIVQDKEYPEWDYGYEPAMIEGFKAKYGYSPLDKEDPSKDKKWLQFRCDQITDAANDIAKVVHAAGLQMCASPFPSPSVARSMVRQDWGKWELDLAFPMIYQGCYVKGREGLNFIRDCVKENTKAVLPMTTAYCALYAPDFHDNPDYSLTEAMDLAMDNGARGIGFYTYEAFTPDMKTQMKAFIKKMNDKEANK